MVCDAKHLVPVMAAIIAAPSAVCTTPSQMHSSRVTSLAIILAQLQSLSHLTPNLLLLTEGITTRTNLEGFVETAPRTTLVATIKNASAILPMGVRKTLRAVAQAEVAHRTLVTSMNERKCEILVQVPGSLHDRLSWPLILSNPLAGMRAHSKDLLDCLAPTALRTTHLISVKNKSRTLGFHYHVERVRMALYEELGMEYLSTHSR